MTFVEYALSLSQTHAGHEFDKRAVIWEALEALFRRFVHKCSSPSRDSWVVSDAKCIGLVTVLSIHNKTCHALA